jgi:DeoR family fructose operon transcriptional repressor
MAAEAVRLIEDDSTVIVDSGTTCLEAGRLLLERPKVRLITNSVPLLYEGWQAGASIIALGGELRNLTGALRGSGAVKGFEVLHADWAILGASGVSATHGISTTEMGEAAVKQAMIRAAGRRILLADGRKWDAPSNVRFADWEDFDFWITSNDLAKTLLHFAPGSRLKIIRS